MYAGMLARWHEVITERTTAAPDETLPLYMVVFSSDKGTENITDMVADDFYKMYGTNADFFKHGQPLIQTHKILDAGARVLAKRLVAADATLANAIISVEVTEKQENKFDSSGKQLYLDEEGNETTEVTDTPATITVAYLKYSVDTVENVKTEAEIKKAVETLAESDTKYPLFIIADNGRGTSVKKVKIAADYNVSKKLRFQLYNITDIENSATVESARFSVYPDAIFQTQAGQKSMALTNSTMKQFICDYCMTGLNKFVDKLAKVTGYSKETLYTLDILFGYTVAGKKLANIALDQDSVQINSEYGIELQSGTNGEFGDAPFAGTVCSSAWEKAAVAYFNGEFSDEIYDIDLHKLDFICDANYPFSVKNAIVDLVNFRKDAFFFRDLGLDVWSYEDVYSIVTDPDWMRTPFAGDYLSNYEVIDQYSRKQIRVTMMYSFAPLLVQHYANNIAAPMAGEFNNFVIREAVAGTLNFAPRHTPKVNQKEDLDNLRVNFVNYSGANEMTVLSTYTSQDHFGPLVYINNVVVTQMVVKAIRRYTPKIRFQLVEADDFSRYRQLIDDNVISSYKAYFRSIELIYIQDEEMAEQSIFTAALECYYFRFAQSEIFDIYAIDGTPTENAANSEKSTIDIV